MKYYISHETHSVYWLDRETETLMFLKIENNNTFSSSMGGDPVDEELIGDEHIYSPFTKPVNFKTFSDVYAEARKALKS